MMLKLILQNPSFALRMAFTLLEKSLPRFSLLIKLLGLATIIKIILKVLCGIYTQFLRRGVNLQKRYGAGSYAFITGASDGIGRAFALALAQRGFHIILVARNAEKLTKVETEIKAINSALNVKKVVVDFTECEKPGFFENIYNEVKLLDISILINNVGLDLPGMFIETDEKKAWELVKVNMLPTVFLTRKLMPKFRLRRK
jgi:17beta-estradiol 17-dehydrogenase / very-long-chain 3-oxoacyl-CoA reductase